MDKFNIPKITPIIPNIPEIKNHNHADEFYKRLVSIIVDFEKNIKSDEEVGVRLVSFGENIIIHIDDIGYWNPSLIYFYGREKDDKKVQLVQHVSQISILLMKVPRTNLERERIGFKMQQKQKEEKEEQ